MKRGWNTLSNPQGRGSEESYQLGQALAAIAEPELLQGLLNVVSSLNEWGGQYMVAAQRERVDGFGQRDPAGTEHVTIGLVHHYKHVPDALKDALREPAPDSLENVEAIPWMESEGPEALIEPTIVEPLDLEGLSPEQIEHYFGEGDHPEVSAEKEAAEEARAEAAQDEPGDPDEADRQADREHEALAESSQ